MAERDDRRSAASALARNEALARIGAALVPFVLTAFYVESIFYEAGAVYNDAGLFAQVIYRNDAWLSVRDAFSEEPLPYFHTHLTFFMWPLSALSRALPVGEVQFIALFHGAVIAIVAAVAQRALFHAFGSRPLSVVGAWAVAFSGLAVHASWNAHFEIVIPALVVATSIALFQGRERLAMGLLLALFVTREDAPFQFALFFGAITVLSPPVREEDRARAWRFLRVAIALGVILFAFQRAFFPPLPVFSLVYSGLDPWAHLTSDVLGARVAYLFAHRVDVWAPLALVLAFGLVLRERFLLAAVAAAAPWFFLHLGASFEGASRFAIHYGFPFVATLLAPSLALVARPSTPAEPSRSRRLGALQIAVLLVASVRADAGAPLYVLSPLVGHYGHRTDAAVVDATEHLLDHLAAEARAGAIVCASDSVSSLRVDLVAHRERIRSVTAPREGCDYIVSFRRDHEAEAVERTRAVSTSAVRCDVEHTALVVDRPSAVPWPFACE